MEAHEVLGVPKDASEEQFRRAYKALAKKWHPDRQLDNSEEATAKFVEVNKAYKTMARNLRRARRAAEGINTPSTTPESSVSGSPPATPESTSSSLPEESTRPSTSRSSSPTQSSTTSQFTSPYSSTSSEHPSPSCSFPCDYNSGPRGRSSSRNNVHLPEDPSSADIPHPGDNYNTSASGSPPSPSSPKPARTRLRKQSKARNCRPDPLTGDYTPKTSRRSPASASVSASTESFHIEQDPNRVACETLCPVRSTLRGAGVDAPKRWVHVLNMTLEEICLGKTFHFRVVRYRKSGKKSIVPLEVYVPPGSRAGSEIVVEDAGNERKDGSWQAVVFQVKEAKHERFRRVHDDLLLEVRLPWVDSLNDEVGEVYLQGIDGQDHMFKVDYRDRRLLSGTAVIPGAGIPSCDGVGRGRIVVRWEISSPSSSWGALKHVLRFKR